MSTLEVDPLDPRVLERDYNYAQKNVRLLTMWYECDIERMLELLATHDIDLSRNDRLQFEEDYRTISQTCVDRATDIPITETGYSVETER